MRKLSQPQRSMLWNLNREAGPRGYSVRRWKIAVDRPQFRTLEVLNREGLVVEKFFALGSTPHVELTAAGREALEGKAPL